MHNIRRSFPAKFKLKVIKFAEEYGNRKAGREFDVDEKSVRSWRKSKKVLITMRPQKRARRCKVASWPELEQELKKWVLHQRGEKRKVSTISIRLKAIQMATEKFISNFTGNSKWCYSFMKRNGLSMRAITSQGQALPIDWEEKVAVFHVFMDKLKNVDLAQFGNMDETPLSFDIPDTRTVDLKVTRDIELTTTGAEKCNFTVILCVTADGGKCDPMVIFKRKTIPKEDFPNGIIV